MISRFEKFSFSISEIYRHLHKIAADEMEKYGLRGSYAVYLLALYRYEDGITAAELCDICDRNKADVSRAMAAMEEKKYVKREGASYRAKLFLTEAGKKAASYTSERARIAVELGGRGLSDEQRETLYRAMDTIAANLRQMSRNGLPEN